MFEIDLPEINRCYAVYLVFGFLHVDSIYGDSQLYLGRFLSFCFLYLLVELKTNQRLLAKCFNATINILCKIFL